MNETEPSVGLLQLVPRRPLPRGQEQALGTPVASARWAPTGARYSRDKRAILIPELHLEPVLVRGLLGGRRPLVDALRGVDVVLTPVGAAEGYSLYTWSYVWGDTALFDRGTPLAEQVVFMRGDIIRPDPSDVMPYVRELTNAR